MKSSGSCLCVFESVDNEIQNKFNSTKKNMTQKHVKLNVEIEYMHIYGFNIYF